MSLQPRHLRTGAHASARGGRCRPVWQARHRTRGRGAARRLRHQEPRLLRRAHVALLFAPDSGDPRLTADVGMYAQTLLLAMAAHGVASCPQALLSFYADTVRQTLGVTGGKLLFGIAFGYADPDAAVNTVAVGREPWRRPRASTADGAPRGQRPGAAGQSATGGGRGERGRGASVAGVGVAGVPATPASDGPQEGPL
ncbi:nitroreductase family protein [Streptomyces sp. M19]